MDSESNSQGSQPAIGVRSQNSMPFYDPVTDRSYPTTKALQRAQEEEFRPRKRYETPVPVRERRKFHFDIRRRLYPQWTPATTPEAKSYAADKLSEPSVRKESCGTEELSRLSLTMESVRDVADDLSSLKVQDMPRSKVDKKRGKLEKRKAKDLAVQMSPQKPVSAVSDQEQQPDQQLILTANDDVKKKTKKKKTKTKKEKEKKRKKKRDGVEMITPAIELSQHDVGHESSRGMLPSSNPEVANRKPKKRRRVVESIEHGPPRVQVEGGPSPPKDDSRPRKKRRPAQVDSLEIHDSISPLGEGKSCRPQEIHSPYQRTQVDGPPCRPIQIQDTVDALSDCAANNLSADTSMRSSVPEAPRVVSTTPLSLAGFNQNSGSDSKVREGSHPNPNLNPEIRPLHEHPSKSPHHQNAGETSQPQASPILIKDEEEDIKPRIEQQPEIESGNGDLTRRLEGKLEELFTELSTTNRKLQHMEAELQKQRMKPQENQSIIARDTKRQDVAEKREPRGYDSYRPQYHDRPPRQQDMQIDYTRRPPPQHTTPHEDYRFPDPQRDPLPRRDPHQRLKPSHPERRPSQAQASSAPRGPRQITGPPPVNQPRQRQYQRPLSPSHEPHRVANTSHHGRRPLLLDAHEEYLCSLPKSWGHQYR